uniref:SFRICE_015762 n=1 Tax=Spodoptera frugiperda TaxID=7108 RepID=A0A2H1WHM2_SPOFR
MAFSMDFAIPREENLVRFCFTFKEIETRAHSAFCLVGSFEPANQSAERALLSITLNVKQTHTKVTIEPSMRSCPH